MDLDGIDVFVEVVDAQSFTRAAQRLGLPISTVSAKLARLEARLGVTLIRRTTRQLHVTPAGRAYYAHCVRALAALSQGAQELADVVQEPSGLLRITAPADLVQTLLAPLVERFLALYPKTRVELVITNTTLDLIATGIDLALRAGILHDSSLVIRRFRSGRLGLWASREYLDRVDIPIVPADLADHDFIRFTRMGDRLVFIGPGNVPVELPINSRLAADDLDSVRAFIVRGNGIGALPDFMTEDGAAAGRLVRILPDYASEAGGIHFVYPAQRHVPQTVRAFVDLATAS